MKGHAAAPDGQHLEGVGEVFLKIVEQDVADPPAQHDPERHPDDHVVDVVGGGARHVGPKPLVAGQPPRVEPAADQAGDVGEGIPADRERAELDRDRIDGRQRQGKNRHG